MVSNLYVLLTIKLEMTSYPAILGRGVQGIGGGGIMQMVMIVISDISMSSPRSALKGT
jgi:hypothetical protein